MVKTLGKSSCDKKKARTSASLSAYENTNRLNILGIGISNKKPTTPPHLNLIIVPNSLLAKSIRTPQRFCQRTENTQHLKLIAL